MKTDKPPLLPRLSRDTALDYAIVIVSVGLAVVGVAFDLLK
jgi:hypothetical protein